MKKFYNLGASLQRYLDCYIKSINIHMITNNLFICYFTYVLAFFDAAFLCSLISEKIL